MALWRAFYFQPQLMSHCLLSFFESQLNSPWGGEEMLPCADCQIYPSCLKCYNNGKARWLTCQSTLFTIALALTLLLCFTVLQFFPFTSSIGMPISQAAACRSCLFLLFPLCLYPSKKAIIYWSECHLHNSDLQNRGEGSKITLLLFNVSIS